MIFHDHASPLHPIFKPVFGHFFNEAFKVIERNDRGSVGETVKIEK
jgi:hypothetical protein